MGKEITHRGKIVGATNTHLTVRIDKAADECAKCAIAASCQKETDISVPHSGDNASLIGKTAVIGTSDKTRLLAIVLYLAMPLLLIINTLAICGMVTDNQLTAGIWAIFVTAAWYAILYALRGKMRSKTYFRVIEIEK